MRLAPGGIRRCRPRTALVAMLGILWAGYAWPTAAAPQVHTVIIDGMRFSPQTLLVKAGDTVIWKNKDPYAHTATADGPGFHSGKILPDRTWRFVAHKRGSFPYSCAQHEPMNGTLIVN